MIVVRKVQQHTVQYRAKRFPQLLNVLGISAKGIDLVFSKGGHRSGRNRGVVGNP
jgi:hypothetical protein